MTEIRLPIPPIVDNLPVEIEIRPTGSGKSILYKIVSVPYEKKLSEQEQQKVIWLRMKESLN